MARSPEQITNETLRELTYQSPGFWSRMFRRAISSMMPDFQPRQAPLFDRIVGRIGSANVRNIRTYAQDTVNPGVAFPQKAADHFLRTVLHGAEALGATAEELNAIDWEHIDLRQAFTENADRWFDLSRLPGLSDKLIRVFDGVGRHINTAFMDQIVRSYPEHAREKVQSASDIQAERDKRDREFDTLFEKLNMAVQWAAPDPQGTVSPSRPGEAFFDKIARMVGSDFRIPIANSPHVNDFISDDQGNTVLNPDQAVEKINSFIEEVFGQRTKRNSIDLVRKAIGATAPIVGKVATGAFNLLPAFVRRPILLGAGRIGAATAQAAGQGTQAQINAATAAMGAARIAAGLKAMALGFGTIVAVAGAVISVFKNLAKFGAEAVDRVSQYSGALAFARASFERSEKMREIRMARELAKGPGVDLWAARDRFAEAKAPSDEAAANIGASIGSTWEDLKASGLEALNYGANRPRELFGWDTIAESSLAAVKYLNDFVPIFTVVAGVVKKIGETLGLVEENTRPDKDGGKIVPMHAFGAKGDPMRDWFDAMLPNKNRRVPPVVPPAAAQPPR